MHKINTLVWRTLFLPGLLLVLGKPSASGHDICLSLGTEAEDQGRAVPVLISASSAY